MSGDDGLSIQWCWQIAWIRAVWMKNSFLYYSFLKLIGERLRGIKRRIIHSGSHKTFFKFIIINGRSRERSMQRDGGDSNIQRWFNKVFLFYKYDVFEDLVLHSEDPITDSREEKMIMPEKGDLKMFILFLSHYCHP